MWTLYQSMLTYFFSLLQVRHQFTCYESFDDLPAGARAVWRALGEGGHPVVGGSRRRGRGSLQPVFAAVYYADSIGPTPRRHRPAPLPHASVATPSCRTMRCNMVGRRKRSRHPRSHRCSSPLLPSRTHCPRNRVGILHRVLNTWSYYSHRHRVLHVREDLPCSALLWTPGASPRCQRTAATRTSHDPTRSC